MRARAFCAALALTLLTAPAAAQTGAAESPPPEVDGPQLPPDVPKPAPIIEIPLPAALPPVVHKPKPRPAPVVIQPKTAPAAVATPPPPAAAQKPRGECVIKPVMSDDDLYNCGALR